MIELYSNILLDRNIEYSIVHYIQQKRIIAQIKDKAYKYDKIVYMKRIW